ncbi:MAG: site-specific integrase [Gammaproteobacteria bacterium]|nr:site-specific integrase [Gammaproteobacteria bacterium]MCW8840425.1 site-specific integrase [Gammaproteobacteria bacterium]MCW8957487.1 site-specific integrase [Gammaproteobacteria bacterium]MCW8991807.1 site-specific integrase [Gammaproteobacteria bacterium]
MPKSGQARVPNAEQQRHLFEVIQQHRHPEKNTAIMQISFKLGLRAQEIALLQIKEVAQLSPSGTDFKLHEVMSLPAAYTKGADAMKRSKTQYQRKSISFDIDTFNKTVRQIEAMAKAGADIRPEDFYPRVKKHKGKSRDLPIVDPALRTALTDYLELRLSKEKSAKPTDPLFVSQKGGPYSPNTLQEHMALMLRNWAGIEKASSHSGRRSLITNVIHKQNKSVKVAQKIAGHVNPSTTLIYEEPPEEILEDALNNL